MKIYAIIIFLVLNFQVSVLAQITCGTGDCLPGNFSLNAPSSITQNSINLSWSSSFRAQSYTVYYRVSGSPTWDVGGFCTSCTTLSQPGLQAGTLYQFYVEAYRSTVTPTDCEGCLNSNEITAATSPPAPAGLTITPTALSPGFTSSWIAATGATNYDVQYKENSASIWNNACVGATATSCQINGLTGNTLYNVQVRANNGTSSPFSSPMSATTVPGVPDITTAMSIGQNSFIANWTAALGGASTYTLQVASNIAFTTNLQTITNIASGNQAVGSLSPGTIYYYRVRAHNNSGFSDYSTIKTILTSPPTPVVAASASASLYEINVSWGDLGPGVTYDVQYKISSPTSSWIDICIGTSGTSCLIPGLTGNTSYDVRVSANNGTSSLPSIVSATTIPAVPDIVSATSIAQNSFIANWSAAIGAGVSYTLQVAEDNSFTIGLQTLSSLSSVSQLVVSLSPGTIYYYRVRASNGSGISEYSTIKTILTSPATPVAVAEASSTLYEANVSWTAVPTAVSYDVQYKESAGSSWTNVCTGTTSTSCIVSGLSGHRSYEFQVRASNGTNSPFSASASATTIPGVPNAANPIVITQNAFVADWGTATGYSTFTLQVASDNGFTNDLQTFSDLASNGFAVNSLNPGTAYYYRVRANNSTGSSAYSNTISLITSPATPVVSANASPSAYEINVSWAAITSATGYDVQYKQSSASTWVEAFNDIATTACSITGLFGNASYDIQVRAKNGTNSPFSIPVSSTTIPNAPSSGGPWVISQTGFQAAWDNLGVIFTLQVSTDNFALDVQTFSNIPYPWYSVDGLTPGTAYHYRVRAENTTGASAYSEPVLVITSPSTPVVTASPSIANPAITASWPAIPSDGSVGVSYDVQYKQGSSGDWVNICTGISSTNCTIPALTGNTSYDVQVRASNGTSSPFSSIVSATTIPAVPGEVRFISVNQSSFIANWTAPSGGTQTYTLQVAADNSFATGLQTFAGLTETSININTSIYPNTQYFCRVKADNGTGSSTYSSATSVLTAPATPAVSAAPSLSLHEISITWTSTGTSYDVQYKQSGAASWISICTGTTSNSCLITGLLANAAYDFRVSAYNGTYSPYASATSRTIPSRPTEPLSNNITSSGFIASWTASEGGTGFYELELSLNSSFTSLVPGYNPKIIEGTVTELPVVGLVPSTAYWWRLRAGNTTGVTSYSVVKAVGTLSGGGGNSFDITYSNLNYNGVHAGGNETITIDVKAYFYPLTVKLFHRKTSETDFQQLLVTLSGNPNDTETALWQVNPDWMDELGYEFKIEIQDFSGQIKQVPLESARRLVNWSYSPERSGNSVSDYVMLSSPYAMPNNIEDTFERTEVAGQYDPAEWRMLHYENGKLINYKSGLSKTEMVIGQSYWFLTRRAITMNFGQFETPDNTSSNPFEMHLPSGWVQIGNPFPFAISWDAALEANDNPEGVSRLKVFDPATRGFREAETLPAFGGGFVLVENPAELLLPVTLRGRAPGRSGIRQDVEKFSNSPDADAWLMPFTITHNKAINTIGGIGMHPSANRGKDKFDEITPPRFLEYMEWTSTHSDYFMPDFSRDVVPTQDTYTWTFHAEHEGESGPVVITWDNEILAGSRASIILHDLTTQELIDLSTASNYSFTGNKRTFNVYYNSNGAHLSSEQLTLGKPYPNPPIQEKVFIPFAYSNQPETVRAVLDVFDNTGKKVSEVEFTSIAEGLHQLEWNCASDGGKRVAAGIYFFRLRTMGVDSPLLIGTSKQLQQTFTGKIVIP